MPELPEVETVRRGLAPHLLGRRVLSVEVREARLRVPIRRRALGRIRGARVTAVRRRSKYLLVETDAGVTLLMHLGMTGQLWIADRDRPRRPHEHLVFTLDDGRQLRFADARRFGFVDLVESRSLGKHPRLRHLGPEPLEEGFTAAACQAAGRGRRKPIKNFLMDTRAVAGIGNIYACEALHRASLNPRRPVSRIPLPAWERLIAALRAVLNEALRAGGTTRRDFLNAEGEPGYFAVSLRVYDREGKACLRCGRPIRRIVQAGRSTFYCPGCQR
jgi:formamidopyrimidine-DNA glycosylase